jgi:cytochrome P450
MGRLPELWGEDATLFRPERFLEEPNPSQFKFISFNAGPRLCLGMNMAYLEAMTALAFLVHQFDWKLAVQEEKVQYQNGLTLPMRFGLPMKFEQRK